ncbi:hypothetical protein FACS1894195_0400 [Bacteroidia bacterium]|nr:hypothetical protein FACS1894195_0400 [Bacteroidia bacterium]
MNTNKPFVYKGMMCEFIPLFDAYVVYVPKEKNNAESGMKAVGNFEYPSDCREYIDNYIKKQKL